jgi:serine protease AprX
LSSGTSLLTGGLGRGRVWLATLAAAGTIVTLTLTGAGAAAAAVNPTLGYDPSADTGSLDLITQIVGARSAWTEGYTGKGVDVALIDTGVSPVAGLNSGNVVNGPDLSTDSGNASLRYLDGYGHGTHMASIIAGRDAVSTPAGYAATGTGKFDGVAPDARIINVKVGAANGAADVSQVIAGITWVTQHAHDNGLNIRVINLSYGTSGTQSYLSDPLAYAVETAWRNGIVVVVGAGNDGTKNVNLANPALDPNVLAVGAEDPMGTTTLTDDTIPDFSNRGTNQRHVDVVAPGTHVLGLRVPGSQVDLANPSAAVGTRFIRGSGTSQATAVTSGVVALILQAHPTYTPDQVKWLLTNSATRLSKATTINHGSGVINAATALATASLVGVQGATGLTASAHYGTGTGSLELARGSSHLLDGSATLTGEQDIFGRAWNGATWAPKALAGTSWSGGTWQGTTWTGTTMGTAGWTSAPWTSNAWDGSSWSALNWTGRSWVNGAWVGQSWTSSAWSGRSWVDQSWSSSSWS